ncbi:MAG: hypothetical protein V1816_26405 [Pseudomonadota bacterium]
MMLKRLFLLLSVVIVVGLMGCDGSSSGSSTASSVAFLTRQIQGVVVDGPIKGALVVFHKDGKTANVCGSTGSGKCQAETDDNGNFETDLNIYEDPDALILVSTDGQDTDTHVDFGGINLKARMSWFSDQGYSVVISPITTFLMVQGDDQEEAEERVRRALGIGAGVNLYADPSSDQNLHNGSILLSLLAAGLRDIGFDEDIFEILEQRSPDVLVDADGKLTSQAAAQIFPDNAEIAQRIVNVFGSYIDAGGDPQAIYEGEIVYAITRLLEQDENYPGNLTDEEEAELKNRAAKLAEKIIQAAGESGVPLDGYHPGQVCRYALFIYFRDSSGSGLSYYQVFMAGDSAAFEARIAGIPEDANIEAIASSQALINVMAPLGQDGLLGDDNQKRLEYYFDSNISHLFKAAKTIDLVLDDEINDGIILEVVKGKAENGFFDEALSLVETQLWQSENIAHGYRYYANRLMEWETANRSAPSVQEALQKSEALYYKVIESKGKENLASSDTSNLQSLASSYREAGFLDDAERVLEYLKGCAVLLQTVASYGRLIVGTWNVADDYIALGDYSSARPLVEDMWEYSSACPANIVSGHSYYKAKVFNLAETALRFAELYKLRGSAVDRAAVVSIVEQIESIRANDGLENLTAANTWVYISYMVEALYGVGENQAAYGLIETIPTTYNTYKLKCYKLTATAEALEKGIEAAAAIIETYIMVLGDAEDAIEAWTYLGVNKLTPYVALALIQAGRNGEALLAIDRAKTLVDGLGIADEDDRYDALISFGYVKLADLYYSAGNEAMALTCLQAAEGAANGFGGQGYVVMGLVETALGYQNLGQSHLEKAMNLLAQAETAADQVDPKIHPTSPVMDVYAEVISGYLSLKSQEDAARLIPKHVEAARAIFTAFTAESDHDKYLKYEITYLLKSADFYVQANLSAQAPAVIAEALGLVDLIYDADEKIDYRIKIVEAYAAAGFYDEARAVADAIPYVDQKNEAIQVIAATFAGLDDFPETSAAVVDTDKDGKPNFFHPLAGQEEIDASGLVLDDDSDGDGVPDSVDVRPLYASSEDRV